jgi:hypothetical protein
MSEDRNISLRQEVAQIDDGFDVAGATQRHAILNGPVAEVNLKLLLNRQSQ